MDYQEEKRLLGEDLLRAIQGGKTSFPWAKVLRAFFKTFLKTGSFSGFDAFGDLRFGVPTRVADMHVSNKHDNILSIDDATIAKHPVRDGICCMVSDYRSRRDRKGLLINTFTVKRIDGMYRVVCNVAWLFEIKVSNEEDFFWKNSFYVRMKHAVAHAMCDKQNMYVELNEEVAFQYMKMALHTRKQEKGSHYWNHAPSEMNTMHVPCCDMCGQACLVDETGSIIYE